MLIHATNSKGWLLVFKKAGAIIVALVANLYFANARAVELPPAIDNQFGYFYGYADRKPPVVPGRKDDLTFYPCSQCHDYWQTNVDPRTLYPVHDVGLDHGQQRFWCLTCHSATRRDSLTTLQGVPVDFNDAWRVCGQCHSARQKDWYYGAHGKRVETWRGEPERYNCTHCHNPHQPPFVKRKPQPKPPIRVGLEPMKHHDRLFAKVWEKKEIWEKAKLKPPTRQDKKEH